jgi:hypothetical protein
MFFLFYFFGWLGENGEDLAGYSLKLLFSYPTLDPQKIQNPQNPQQKSFSNKSYLFNQEPKSNTRLLFFLER